MTPVGLDDPAIRQAADDILSAIEDWLRFHGPIGADRRQLIRGQSLILAQIATGPGRPITPFVYLGARRTEIELKRLRLGRAKASDLHAGAIAALAAAGTMRGDLIELEEFRTGRKETLDPRSGPTAGAIAKLAADGATTKEQRDLSKAAIRIMVTRALTKVREPYPAEIQKKPTRRGARAFASVVASTYEQLTGKDATRTENQDGFIALLDALDHVTPQLDKGNTARLARAVLQDRAKRRRTAQAPSDGEVKG